MASQLRLQVLVPIVVVALLGLGVSTFVMSRNKPETSDADAIAARIAARHQQTTTPAKPKPAKKHPEPAPPQTEHVPHSSPLKTALAHHSVAVVLFYKPGSDYDAIQIREARAAALSADAGFVTINVDKNREVAKLASQYNVLESPTVLVFRRGPKLRARLEGYHDRTTIVQAVQNA